MSGVVPCGIAGRIGIEAVHGDVTISVFGRGAYGQGAVAIAPTGNTRTYVAKGN